MNAGSAVVPGMLRWATRGRSIAQGGTQIEQHLEDGRGDGGAAWNPTAMIGLPSRVMIRSG